MTVTPTQQSFESSTPKPKRRWLQFNLRTLLVLTLVVGLGLGWVMYERRKNARIQARIQTNLHALKRLGCNFEFYPDNSFRPSRFDWLLNRSDFGTVLVYFGSSTVTDAELDHLKGLTNLHSLRLYGSPNTDAGLLHLKSFSNVRSLDLHRTEITDVGFAHLKGLTNLNFLSLSQTKITDAGLVHLKGLTNLNFLSLNETKITDAGLVHLRGLTKLEKLKLTDTAITDSGLEKLKHLAQLTQLDLRWTKVTKSGVARLQKALPNCTIYDDAIN
ncbi:MAG: hypothetical protein ABL888_17785 [Pirellulaceae bacterium]